MIIGTGVNDESEKDKLAAYGNPSGGGIWNFCGSGTGGWKQPAL